MGIFGGSTNAFDPMIEKVTDEKNTGEDWGEIMSVCDRVGATANGPKECLRALIRRLNNPDPHVVLQAITLLDACVNNCGRHFLLEVASRDFETEFKKLLTKSHPKIVEKLKNMLKNWAEGEFSKDPQYSLIPSLYASLRRDGLDFSSQEERVKKSKVPSDPLVVSSQQEEEDIAKAIQLSLQESKGKGGGDSASKTGSGLSNVLYPTDSLYSGSAAAVSAQPVKKEEEKKARALYDFEAAEDNELTFKSGEIVIILDDADPNWWKGSNHRGEGLFPSNFVTMDMAGAGGERKRSVVFNEEVEVKEVEQVTWPAQSTIDEEKINSLLGLLHDADPTTGDNDPAELARLEDQVTSMGPLIDTELEQVDRRHAQLTRLSHQLVDALTLYHTLMRDTGPPLSAYNMYQHPSQPYPQMQPGPGMAPPMMNMPGPGGMVMTGGPLPSMQAMNGGVPQSMPAMTGGVPPNMPAMSGGGMPMTGGPPTSMQAMSVGVQPNMPAMTGGAPPNMPGMSNMQPMTMTPSSSAGGSIPVQYMEQQQQQQQYPGPGYPGYTMVPGSAPPPTPPLHSGPPTHQM